MNQYYQFSKEVRRQAENITCDIEHIISFSSCPDEYHYIKQKWLIGRRLAQEEVRLRQYGGIPEEVKTLVSQSLWSKYGSEFKMKNLEQNMTFYYMHLNLFESALHLDYKLLSWKHYVLLMDIKDDTIRRRIEKDAFDYGWNIKMLSYQIRQAIKAQISI